MTRNVAELVERKIVNKDGSQASDGEFNRCCSFSICPAECWLTKPANAVFRNSDFFAQVKNEDQPGCGYETNSQRCPTWFQSPGQLMDLYFFDASVVLISERPYSCQSCSGIHQVQRKDWRRDQLRYWSSLLGDKEPLVDLRDEGEIAQTAAEVAGELEAMSYQCDIKPRRYAAVRILGNTLLWSTVMQRW